MKKEVTVLAYIEKDDCFLMLLRNKKKNDPNEHKWIGVGGHIEEGETPEVTLKREIKEETNLDVIKYQERGLIHFINSDYQEDMYLFTVSEYSGELSECDEGTLKFIPKSEVLNLNLWEGDKVFLALLKDNAPYFEINLHYINDVFQSWEYVN